ncbi:hypothetical protein BU17DRAFT_83004 [Hysterangium stoloniferum]|nr:hypothetical protein BU17DRAFT_83004 [Hysterangium stoloniferum]
MPSIEVEHPRLSHRLSLDDVPFPARSPSRRPSHTPVINIDDDEVLILSGQPPTNRRRIEPDNDIYILDHVRPGRASERGNSTHINRGGRSRPIIILDSDDELASTSSNTQRPPGRVNVPAAPIVAQAGPSTVLPRAGEDAPSRARPLSDDPPQPGRSANVVRPRGARGIHLGGGVMSFGNRMVGLRGRYQPETHHNNPRGASTSSVETFTRYGRVIASFFPHNPQVQPPPQPAEHEWPRWGAPLGDAPGWGAPGWDAPGRGAPGWGAPGYGLPRNDRGGAGLALGPTYHRTLTHPDWPGPGWTFDFGPDPDRIDVDDDGSEIMACAKCLDPLLANADGMVGASEAEKKERRVWALRCGHVLDGKCVAALMIPEDEQKQKMSLKGKEKEVLISIDEGRPEFDGGKGIPTADIKGKGKAPALSPNPASFPVLIIEDNDTIDLSLTTPSELPGTSIRSRLRSRRDTAASGAPPVPLPPPRARRGTKRKRAEPPRAPSPVVERRHEWVCPVAKCGKVHASYKVKGVWKMDEEMGAVGMYV